MKTVSVAKLKSELSHYLQIARGGEEIIVTSHNHPVARIVSTVAAHAPRPLPKKATRAAWMKIKGVKPLKPVDVVAMLREDRDSR